MNKKLTTRETVMVVILGIVVLAVCYYKLYFTPTQARIAEYDTLTQNIQMEIDSNTIIALDMNRMDTVIDEKKNDGETHAIPFYDNSLVLMNDLNSILKTTDAFSLNFGDTTADDYLVKRPVTLSYTTASYVRARNIIDRLNSSDNVCQIGDMSVTIGEESTTVNLAVTYYEVQP